MPPPQMKPWLSELPFTQHTWHYKGSVEEEGCVPDGGSFKDVY